MPPTTLGHFTLLLAQSRGSPALDEALTGFSRGFSSANTGDVLTIWIAGSLILSLLALVSLRVHRARADDRRRHGPALRMVGADLGLSRRHQRHLMSMSEAAGLDNGCTLLLSRGAFEFASRTSGIASEDLADLRDNVFG